MAFERYCRWLAKYLILSPSFRASLTGNDALFASARPVNQGRFNNISALDIIKKKIHNNRRTCHKVLKMHNCSSITILSNVNRRVLVLVPYIQHKVINSLRIDE